MQADIKQLEDSYSLLSNEVASLEGKESLLDKQIKEIEIFLEDDEKKKELYTKAIEILDLAQKATQENIKTGFETVVTQALQFIMGEGYSFSLDFNRRGTLQEANFNIITPELPEYYDPIETETGGGLDVVSLALRVAFLELYKPKIEGPLILDEPFKGLDKDRLPQSGEFLNALVERVGRQVIMVSHKEELINTAYNIIEVK